MTLMQVRGAQAEHIRGEVRQQESEFKEGWDGWDLWNRVQEKRCFIENDLQNPQVAGVPEREEGDNGAEKKFV